MTESSPRTRPGVTALHLVALAALLALLVVPRWSSPQFTDTDAAVHAMTGAFFLDLARDRPSPADLLDYAQRYYARSPALGLVIYPPLVPLSLAPAYAVLGVSAATARIVILLYAVLYAWALYGWVRSRAGATAGFAAAVLGALNPQAVTWASEVMLEVPACAFLVMAAWAWTSWLDELDAGARRPGLAALAVLALVAAIHAKQTAGFLAIPMVFELVRRRGWRGMASGTAWAAAAGGAVLLLPLAALTRRFGAYGTVQLDPATYGLSPWSLDYWTHWMRQMPDAVHVAVLAAPVLALVLLRPRLRARSAGDTAARNLALTGLAWFTSWYVVFSWLPIKTHRFAFFAVPALAAVGGLLLARFPGAPRPTGRERFARAAGIALALVALHAGATLPAPRLGGYDAVAAQIVSRGDGRPVLFDDYHSANVIFAARRIAGATPLDGPEATRLPVILRGSKTLTVTASGALRADTRITTPEGLRALLDKTGVEWIYVEDWPGDSLALPHSRWLRETLSSETSTFRLEDRFPLEGGTPFFEARSVLAYRYLLAPPPPESGVLELEVPSAGMTIRVPVGRGVRAAR